MHLHVYMRCFGLITNLSFCTPGSLLNPLHPAIYPISLIISQALESHINPTPSTGIRTDKAPIVLFRCTSYIYAQISINPTRLIIPNQSARINRKPNTSVRPPARQWFVNRSTCPSSFTLLHHPTSRQDSASKLRRFLHDSTSQPQLSMYETAMTILSSNPPRRSRSPNAA